MADGEVKALGTITFKASGGSATFTPTSLADGAGRVSNAYDLSALTSGGNLPDFIKLWIQSTAVSTPTIGMGFTHFNLWSPDNTIWGAGTGSDAAFSDIGELPQLGQSCQCPFDNDTSAHVWDIPIRFAVLGRYLAVGWWNELGVALSSTAGDHIVNATAYVVTG